jgi:hypothetical protein
MGERFVRFQSPDPTRRGSFNGVFALTNGLARAGLLTDEEHRYWREHNAWYNVRLLDPRDRVSDIFDKQAYPRIGYWFRTTAAEFLAPVPGYLEILRPHELACVEVRSDDPGLIVYEDEYQIVVVPYQAQATPDCAARS